LRIIARSLRRACERSWSSEDELVHLSLAIMSINGWNRLNVAARTVPGGYVAGSLAKYMRRPGDSRH
jgi:hypothetical protein